MNEKHMERRIYVAVWLIGSFFMLAFLPSLFLGIWVGGHWGDTALACGVLTVVAFVVAGFWSFDDGAPPRLPTKTEKVAARRQLPAGPEDPALKALIRRVDEFYKEYKAGLRSTPPELITKDMTYTYPDYEGEPRG